MKTQKILVELNLGNRAPYAPEPRVRLESDKKDHLKPFFNDIGYEVRSVDYDYKPGEGIIASVAKWLESIGVTSHGQFTGRDILRALNDGSWAREELVTLMCDLSEEYWSAGWMQDLEVRLWEIVIGEAANRPLIPDASLKKLDQLISLTGGWFSFEDEDKVNKNNNEAYFVLMAEWLKEYERRKK
jgi:hypothetical protein